MTDVPYTEPLPLGPDTTEYRLVTSEGVALRSVDGHEVLEVAPEVLRTLTRTAMEDMAHLLRPSHLAQLRTIVDDPEASGNDRFVASDLLRNAAVAAGGVLPMCQDTGTAVVIGQRSNAVRTDGDDHRQVAAGVRDAYARLNLRYSQMAPLTMWEEVNTGTNLPAQIDIKLKAGNEPRYELLFMAKGGGSANKTFLYQESKAILSEERMLAFLEDRLRSLGTAACPPYHLAIVVGGSSADQALTTAKLASTRQLDALPDQGSPTGHGFRDRDFEQRVHELTRRIGYGAQFGGKYFCHDVRVVRLPRHGGSLPIALAVSCSADRQAKAVITPEGAYLERLETDPARFQPPVADAHLSSDAVSVDLDRPMDEIRARLSTLPVGTRLSLNGTIVVARDIAHARIRAALERGEPMPAYLRDHPVYYAGPAKTPQGRPSGSFGPTTAGRMDGYVEEFQRAGGSLVMLAKGNRSRGVVEACRAHGGFYLGSVGGPAARLAQECIREVEVLDHSDLGMEAVWRIRVEDFPAFMVIDDKGGDFFAPIASPTLTITPRPGT
ncbi:FumA C-terminus/TtdB family hydratase beta subunit [Nocardiopsis sp. MG754419]|uniref:FumA C-terminus/TtdB family hydratase beta subunit n=1 Tax=Nocardiopsis sp. MG754419 TaxID=2259865 RepID=UPI001BAB1C3F|nr:FumA C-terminus/TtdB family hydratase beta subunit [Nocardiopsis sp. MG754419]MBR8740584.1 fumarate hydratase [Nocardiopsis sp. MG754419]